jgi:uncharacterized membrane protein YGL010W
MGSMSMRRGGMTWLYSGLRVSAGRHVRKAGLRYSASNRDPTLTSTLSTPPPLLPPLAYWLTSLSTRATASFLTSIGTTMGMRDQYEYDLLVYQMGHRNLYNRILHYICIPIEIGTFSILVHHCLLWRTNARRTFTQRSSWGLLRRRFSSFSSWIRYLAVPVSHFAIGTVSFYLSPSNGIGLLVWLFHVSLAYILLLREETRPTEGNCYFHTVFLIWIFSFLLQIVLGHYLLERNHPTFIEPTLGVSGQAILTSVLLAWNS